MPRAPVNESRPISLRREIELESEDEEGVFDFTVSTIVPKTPSQVNDDLTALTFWNQRLLSSAMILNAAASRRAAVSASDP